MHVRGLEVEHVAGAVAELARGAAEHEALLEDLARNDGHRPARLVVVVEPRVVAGHPGDDPDVDVAVAAQLLEPAARGGQGDERPPERGQGSTAGEEPAQRAAVEVPCRGELGKRRERRYVAVPLLRCAEAWTTRAASA